MARQTITLAGALALVMALAPVSAVADQPNAQDFVVSQDARFFMGQLVRADRVPAGIRTITYAQYVTQQRNAGLTPRSIDAMLSSTGTWTIGVFR